MKKYKVGDLVRFTTDTGTHTGTIVSLYALPKENDLADIESEDNKQLFLCIVTDYLEPVEN